MHKETSKRQIKKSIISLGLIAVLVIAVSATGWITRQRPSSEMPMETADQNMEPDDQSIETHIQHVMRKIEAQQKVDKILQAELESGSYTFESPLTVLDPYGEVPLTALILFETEEPSKIEITIPGKDEDTGVVHVFEEVATRHTIPVYGLYPDTVNEITLRQLSEDNEVIAEKVVEIQTESLPEWLTNYVILTESYEGDYEAGLNYMSFPYLFAFDKEGTPRWYLSDLSGQLNAKSYSYTEQHWFVPYDSAADSYLTALIVEIDSLGKIFNVFYDPYTVHHDIEFMPNGNLLVLNSHGSTLQDLIVEIDIESGEVINTLDLKTVLQRTRFGSIRDWAHMNSIVWDERDGTIIISSNTQCTVAKLTWPEGEIKWLLSDPIEYMPRLQQYLLRPVGTDFEYTYNQHHATILPDYDNNPDTIDLLLFDNGRTRFDRDKELQRAIAAHEIVAPEKYSRLVHYRINEKDMTVEQIWQYGKERGEELLSNWCGSAQLLPNNNILGYFDKQNDPVDDIAVSGNIVEVDHNGNLVWDAELFSKSERGNAQGYRAFRFPFYLDDREHDIYTEAVNLIPQAVLDVN